MKIKSVSDNNLENIKQMINVALKDSDQIAKLHQAIYEEWYFEKMKELRDTRNRIKNEVPSCPSNNLTKNISNGVDLRDTQTGKTKKKLKSNITEHQNQEQNKGKLAKQMRRKLSFESWKRGKNLIYRKLLKKAEEQQQRELQKKLEEIECKKASQKAYAQIIKEKEIQQKRKLKELQMIQQTNIKILQRQNDERRIINDQLSMSGKDRRI